MKIRTRLTLWYAAILIVSLIVMGIGTYQEIAEQLQHDHRHNFWEHALNETSEMVLWVGLPAIILGLLGGWWITRKVLTPITSLTDAVEKIHERNLNSQLPRSKNGDELDRLTEVFNAMTARLDDSFNRIREFTLHASHELKTPLTVMRGELETALREGAQDPATRERLLSQLDEIQRLATMVDALSLLTKADAGLIALKAEPLRLDELVRESHADAQILARPYRVEVDLGRCEEVLLPGDRHRLRQLLLNLTDNAIKYNLPHGKVTIDLARANGHAELKITNTGAGIPVELQPRIFDRFFRGDLSHNSEIEGCGLGLSIAQWIVTAHHGTIRVESVPQVLTTATVLLPIPAH